MPDKPLGYVRVSEDTHAWLTAISEDTRTPVLQVVRAIIEHAREAGWSAERRPTVLRVTSIEPPGVPGGHDPFGGSR
jgi:hypothetical protein